jgi:hypothetical protein
MRRLAEMTSLCERTARKAVRGLELAGAISTNYRPGRSKEFRLASLLDLERRNPGTRYRTTPASDTAAPDTGRHELPDPAAPVAGPPRYHLPTKEPSEGTNEGTQLDSSGSQSIKSADSQRVFDHYRTRLGHPKAKLDAKRARLISVRLRDFTADELCRAIDGCAKSDWHMGRHPKTGGQRYDAIELILRDAAHVERFLSIDSGKVGGSAAVSSEEVWLNRRRFGSAQQDHGRTGLEGFRGVRA